METWVLVFDVLRSVLHILVLALGFWYMFAAWNSWRKGYEIEAMWRILNAILYMVVLNGSHS